MCWCGLRSRFVSRLACPIHRIVRLGQFPCERRSTPSEHVVARYRSMLRLVQFWCERHSNHSDMQVARSGGSIRLDTLLRLLIVLSLFPFFCDLPWFARADWLIIILQYYDTKIIKAIDIIIFCKILLRCFGKHISKLCTSFRQ
jgi:hypothetical protein